MGNNNLNQGFNPPPDLSNAQKISCPLCVGTHSRGPIERDFLKKCEMCDGDRVVLMKPNGAIFRQTNPG